MSAQTQPPLSAERMRTKYGPWAVIAGASEGTGAEYARQLAAVGIHCLLVARRTEPLDKIAQELSEKYRVQARVLSVDLSASDAAQRMKDAVVDVEVGLQLGHRFGPVYLYSRIGFAYSRWWDVGSPLGNTGNLDLLGGTWKVGIIY